MSEWMTAHPRSRAVVLVAVGLVAGLVLLAFVLAGIDRVTGGTAAEAEEDEQLREPIPSTPSDQPETDAPASPEPELTPAEVDDNERQVSSLLTLPDTEDPDVYAAAIAEVLFGMDYAAHTPGDYEEFFAAALWHEIVEDDRARILTTINRRIPTVDMWEQMRSIQQTSDFEVELVWEPRSGRDHREAGDWPDGVVLRNVSGTQTETWQAPEEDTQSSTRPVAVTIGMACPPASSPCRLLSIQPNVES